MPANVTEKKRRQGKGGVWFLIGAILIGTAAGVIKFVPVPGLTAKPKATAPATPSKDPVVERQNQLAAKESELTGREADLKAQREQLKADQTKLTVDRLQVANQEQVSEMYGQMAPDKAAERIKVLDTTTAVTILRRLNPGAAGAILARLDADTAAKLTLELGKAPAFPGANATTPTAATAKPDTTTTQTSTNNQETNTPAQANTSGSGQ